MDLITGKSNKDRAVKNSASNWRLAGT